REGAHVAVISESTAPRFWPAEDPLSKHLKLDLAFRGNFTEFEVVGIAKDDALPIPLESIQPCLSSDQRFRNERIVVPHSGRSRDRPRSRAKSIGSRGSELAAIS